MYNEKITNICFYISDYGYGQASRDIAIIRKILAEFNDVKIYVKTDGPFNFKEDELIGTKVEELGIGRFISEWVWRGRLNGTMRR